MADPSPRNPLADVLTTTIRELYAERVVSERRREMLSVAIETIRNLDRKVDRVRDENIHLRAQLRAAISGRTIAAERQQLEDEAGDDASARPDYQERAA